MKRLMTILFCVFGMLCQLGASELSDLVAQNMANKSEGEEFMAANAKKEGVITLESGLQYKVIQSGTGKTPNSHDVVKVNYRGTLLNGTQFDSSDSHGGPATFRVGDVIKGWTKILQLMKEGDEWQVWIPGSLAYGAAGSGSKIGPNQTLSFDIELIAVK